MPGRCAGCARPLEPGAYLVLEVATGRSFHSVSCLDSNGALDSDPALLGALQSRLAGTRDA